MKLSLAALASLLSATTIASAADLPRLDRDHLLLFRDASGTVRRGQSAAGWQLRRAEILRGIQAIPLPGREKRVPLDPQTEREVDGGDHVRRRITCQPVLVQASPKVARKLSRSASSR